MGAHFVCISTISALTASFIRNNINDNNHFILVFSPKKNKKRICVKGGIQSRNKWPNFDHKGIFFVFLLLKLGWRLNEKQDYSFPFRSNPIIMCLLKSLVCISPFLQSSLSISAKLAVRWEMLVGKFCLHLNGITESGPIVWTCRNGCTPCEA